MTGHIGKQVVALSRTMRPPLLGRLILFITRMITGRIELQSVLLLLFYADINWLPGSTNLYGYSRQPVL